MQLSRSLVGTNVKLYFDNFFTAPFSIFKLKEDQIYSCDSIRQNRKGMPKNPKKDKKMKRGVDLWTCSCSRHSELEISGKKGT